MNKKTKVLVACCILCSVCALAWTIFKWHVKAQDEQLVLYGNVDIRQVDLGFRVGGRIEKVLVDEGDSVETGQPLAVLETDILKQQADQARASLDAQKADLEKLARGYRVEEIAQARAAVSASQAVAENAAINLRRVASLRANNAISQKELDNARAANKEAAAKLKSARDNLEMLASGYREEDITAQKAAVASADAALRKAEIQLHDATLLAPQKGIILTRAREAGAIVQEGQTVYTLSLVQPVWIRAYVSEPDLGKIKPGMAIYATADCAPGIKFPGTVGFISPVAEFTPKTVETTQMRVNLVYRIRVQVSDPENMMRQGMPVTITVPLKQVALSDAMLDTD